MESTWLCRVSGPYWSASALLKATLLLPLLAGCAGSGQSSAVVMRDPLVTGCPPGSVRTCEVIGGNKFQKRYGRCVCAAR
jgi:hypothetical protein